MRKISLAILLAVTSLWMTTPPAVSAATLRDGSHDFDFNVGSWHTHITRLLHPLSASTSWVTYDGTVTVRQIWGGSGSVEEIEAHGPDRLELLAVRMYDPHLHQWRLYGTSSADAAVDQPMYGSFADGSGRFYDQESYNGRLVLVRQTFFDITPNSYSFQQAFSNDGGATWQPNFVAKLTRTSATAPSEGSQTVYDTSHDFDFNYGTWSTHIKTPTATMTGTVAIRKVWNGRAFLEEIKAGSGADGFEGITLYLYNPQSNQWSQTYADRSDGMFERSMVGGFHNGRGVLVAFPSQDNGKMDFVREVWSAITPNSHHFEIENSTDGHTWHPVFIATLHRIAPGL